MNRIFGRVLVRETNAGLANLVVAVFDQDRPTPEEGGVIGAELAPGSIDRIGNRLGSVLTDYTGSFEIIYEDDAFTPEPGRSARPDLVLAVFAPEEPLASDNPQSAPPERRLLCLSRFPRTDAGRTEAYVVRLPQDLLKRFQIALDPPPLGLPPIDHVARLIVSAQQGWANREAIREQLATRRKGDVAKARILSDLAKQKFSKLSAVPTPLRTSELFVPPGTPTAAKHGPVIAKDLQRLGALNGPLTIALKPEQLNRLGLTVVNGQLQGPPVGVEALLAEVLGNHGGTDLTRIRILADFATTPEARLKSITDPPADGGATPMTIRTGTILPNGEPVDSETFTSPDVNNMILNRIVGQLQNLEAGSADAIGHRPSPTDVEGELTDLKLRGGAADATAFHDFQVLQVAFRDVWIHAFDGRLRGQAEQLYEEATRLYEDAGIDPPPATAIEDVAGLEEFIRGLGGRTQGSGANVPPVSGSGNFGDILGAAIGQAVAAGACPPLPFPQEVGVAFPDAEPLWNAMSLAQQMSLQQQAAIVNGPVSDEQKRQARATARFVLNHPQGPGGRLAGLLLELGKSLSEPYAFDVFAPDSYNYGILLTYRQRWEPLSYQAGELVATIPLAPGETRKYSKKRVVKTTRAVKEIEKSVSTRSEQSSQTGRAEAEIMQKVSTATNFKLTSHGSYNIGVGSIDISTDFAASQAQESASNKKDFHEATVRAAEEYRLEHSTEVDATSIIETEETSSGEISNPNNEITVTYLFYELQRRYRVSEQLHRARAVIMVAQDVPAPHQIDEGWLIANQWILSRVLLDESLRPALDYLTAGMAGDELATEVLRTQWEKQRDVAEKLENQVDSQLAMRNTLRESLVQTALQQDISKAAISAGNTIAATSTLGLSYLFGNPADKAADVQEAARKAAQTRLQYVEDTLSDAQTRLQRATEAFQQATKEYAAALKQQYDRRVALDQLRVHMKQNILYYMQAIWDHEPPDQRFFRLYNKRVTEPKPDNSQGATVAPRLARNPRFSLVPSAGATIGVSSLVSPVAGNEIDLVEIADLDNPLGYKGNYIIFPLKRPSYLTTYMLREYVDDFFGVRDPDAVGDYTVEELADYIAKVWPTATEEQRAALRDEYISRLTEPRSSSDEVIVPTGQLFIEALPGSHPLLEDFKLRHRLEDVHKVQAEVRHAELENLRLAARLVAGEREDPDIEKQIRIDGSANVAVMDT